MPKKLQRRASGGTDGEVLSLLQAFGSADVDDCVEHLRSFRNKSYARTAVVTLRKVVERALRHPTITGGAPSQEQRLQVGPAAAVLPPAPRSPGPPLHTAGPRRSIAIRLSVKISHHSRVTNPRPSLWRLDSAACHKQEHAMVPLAWGSPGSHPWRTRGGTQDLESRHITQRSEDGAQLNQLSTDSDSGCDGRGGGDGGSGGSSSGEELAVAADERAALEGGLRHRNGRPCQITSGSR